MFQLTQLQPLVTIEFNRVVIQSTAQFHCAFGCLRFDELTHCFKLSQGQHFDFAR